MFYSDVKTLGAKLGGQGSDAPCLPATSGMIATVSNASAYDFSYLQFEQL